MNTTPCLLCPRDTILTSHRKWSAYFRYVWDWISDGRWDVYWTRAWIGWRRLEEKPRRLRRWRQSTSCHTLLLTVGRAALKISINNTNNIICFTSTLLTVVVREECFTGRIFIHLMSQCLMNDVLPYKVSCYRWQLSSPLKASRVPTTEAFRFPRTHWNVTAGCLKMVNERR